MKRATPSAAELRERDRKTAEANAKYQAELRAMAEPYGFESLVIHNNGMHYVFEGLGRVLEWWPSTGKAAANRRYPAKWRAYDLTGLKVLLAKASKLPPLPPPPPSKPRTFSAIRAPKPTDGCLSCGAPTKGSMCPSCESAWAPKTQRSAFR